MTGHIKAWQCIGCGKIEAPQNCIGVCEDRRVEFVYASEHEEALAHARRQMESLMALVRKLARTTPRDGEWERSYRALQQQARKTLATITANAPDSDKPVPKMDA